MSERASSAKRGSLHGPGDRLAARRRLRRHCVFAAFFILLLLLLAATIYGLQKSAVRISLVQVFDADDSLSEYATQAMRGSYFGVIPRDSIFFFPEVSIRADMLAAHPEMAAVSIFRNGLTSLSIKVDNRVPVARWCGATPDLNADCYLFDAKGFIYATASSTSPMNSFIVYGPLVQESSPIGSTLPNAKELPSAFDFARQLNTLGSPVMHIIFRDDEVDDYLASGTRVTYVLGDEQNAFTALVSSSANFNLADGSVEYVDVRFGGNVYLKRK